MHEITLIIDGEAADYVNASDIDASADLLGHFVIVRCRNAGVHAGSLVQRRNGVVRLANSRRLWRWWSKFTLSGLAMCGVLPSKVEEVRFACVLPIIDLTESDVCEVIPCTVDAEKSIMGVKEYSNE